ncbi:MAG: DUF1015 domain-containing protein [Candidatus Bathyarchaeota archaeon]|nr:DUF1015 domain-containing protein [Candidatus Bathyarchaeota archaeon]
MVDIKPFKAIRYTEKAGNLKNLITQPYDKINQDMQREYYEKSPYNYCRLILPLEENRYQTVHQRIYEWLNEHIMAKDDSPSVFVCRQEFRSNGKNHTRTGLIAALRLYPYSENMVFPHETTFAAPKADRLNMLRTIQKDLEPVFLIYSDPENITVDFFAKVTQTAPVIAVEDQFGVKNQVWQITEPDQIRLLQDALADKALVITDGHHRYESAIAYRDERQEQVAGSLDLAFNFHMSYLVPVQDEGLLILPTHRLLRKFELTQSVLDLFKEHFHLTELAPDAETLEAFLADHKTEHVFCMYDGSKAYGMLLKNEQEALKAANKNTPKDVALLDVVILRDFIFNTLIKTGELKIDEDIHYERSLRTAIEKVNQGDAKLAFLINPLDPAMVWQIAQKRERLPEKSTDFYPKPASGLMMMDISATDKL